MDRHLFVAAPWDEADNDSPTLSVYFDITTGHYECFLDRKLVGVIKSNDNKDWVDVETGAATDLSRRAGTLIEKRNAE